MAKGQIFEVEVSGLDVLRRKLETKNFFGPTRQEMIKPAADAGYKKGQKAAKPHPGDKGGIARAIKLTFQDQGNQATIDVEPSVSGIAFVIEEGRRAGRRPPRKAIKDWMGRHGLPTERADVDDMRKGIMERGTAGIHFMAQAAEEADKVLHQRRAPTERAIEREWDRG